MNTFEQIIICKMMLFGYLNHHPKVRAAEGTLERMLLRLVGMWRLAGETEEQIVERFLDMTDYSMRASLIAESRDQLIKDYSYRLANRLFPRELYRLGW